MDTNTKRFNILYAPTDPVDLYPDEEEVKRLREQLARSRAHTLWKKKITVSIPRSGR